MPVSRTPGTFNAPGRAAVGTTPSSSTVSSLNFSTPSSWDNSSVFRRPMGPVSARRGASPGRLGGMNQAGPIPSSAELTPEQKLRLIRDFKANRFHVEQGIDQWLLNQSKPQQTQYSSLFSSVSHEFSEADEDDSNNEAISDSNNFDNLLKGLIKMRESYLQLNRLHTQVELKNISPMKSVATTVNAVSEAANSMDQFTVKHSNPRDNMRLFVPKPPPNGSTGFVICPVESQQPLVNAVEGLSNLLKSIDEYTSTYNATDDTALDDDADSLKRKLDNMQVTMDRFGEIGKDKEKMKSLIERLDELVKTDDADTHNGFMTNDDDKFTSSDLGVISSN